MARVKRRFLQRLLTDNNPYLCCVS